MLFRSRQKEFTQRTALFMESLDVDETVAQLLASEGFATIEDVAYVELHELAQIEAFDEETAQELQSRAVEFIEARNKEMDDKRKALGVEDQVLEVEGVTPQMAVALGEVPRAAVSDAAVLSDWSVYSGRASSSAGPKFQPLAKSLPSVPASRSASIR